MKYANRLTDEELSEVYGLFIDSDGKINELNIKRDECSIGLGGISRFLILTKRD